MGPAFGLFEGCISPVRARILRFCSRPLVCDLRHLKATRRSVEIVVKHAA